MKKNIIFIVLFVLFCCFLSTSLSAAGKVLFSDNFSSMDNWEIAMGGWGAKDNIAECNVGMAFAGDKNWSDYIYEVDAKSNGSADPVKTWLKAYVYLRVRDAANFYRFGIHGDAQIIELAKCENNQWTTVFTYPMIAIKNKWYKFKIEAIGERIKCYVDNKLVIEAKDQAFLQGNIGIGTADDKMSSSYKDIKVTEVDPKSYSPLEVSLSQFQIIKKEIVANVYILKTANMMKFSSPMIKADLVDQNGKIVKTKTADSFDDNGNATVPISIVGVAPGEYTVNISVSDKGKVILSSSKKLNVLDLSWLESKAGVSDEVLPPWTPIVMDGLKVNLWGRTYDFSNSFLPSSIQTAGKSILAAPITLNLNIDGKDVALSAVKPTIVSKSKSKIVLKSDATQDSVNISANVIIEYDGMIRIDLNIDPKTEATINNMVLEIPIKKEFVDLYYWNGVFDEPKFTGSFSGSSGLRIPFRSYIWVGTDDLGMSWFAETDQYWSNKRPKAAISVAPNDEETIYTMKINFVDKPIAINKPIGYTFGLQATPVKEFNKDARKWHFIHHTYYGIEKQPSPGRLSPLEKLKKQGVNTIVFHENWTDIQNYGETSHETELKSLVEACHKLDMKILVYFGYEISSIAPEFEGCHEEAWCNEPGKPFSAWFYTRMPEQNDYRVCYRGPWTIFMANSIKHVVDKYDIDGVYLDTTILPPPCKNYLHGCGYYDDEGTLHTTSAIFGTREVMKRIYTICATKGKLVNVHNFTSDITPILGFSTSYWDGEAYQEQLSRMKEGDFLKVISLAMFRTQYVGRNFGVPAELLVYPKGKWNFETGLAMALLHDTPIRPFINNSGKIFKVWKILDDFGVGDTNCTFLPYYKNQDYVNVSNEGSYSSLYLKPGNSALVVVSNLTGENQDVNVTLNFKKLGLKNPKVSDAFTGDEIEMQKNGDILLPINKFRYKILVVK